MVSSATAVAYTETPATSGAISVRNVRRVFVNASGEETVALERVNLEIQPGEMVSLLGPSGCGKSTLMRIIAGLDQPGEGEVVLDGVPITGPHHERGLVFQDPTLFSWLTVKGNVSFGLKARGIKEIAREVDDYIRLVGLEGFQNAYPHQLSGGMAQRVALARALVNHPKVLLLDEPLGALDAFTRMQMQDEILRIWEDRGTTMVFVTHDVDEAIYMSDRIIVMTPRPGKIQEIIEVRLSRPRARNHPDFFLIRSKILEILHFAGEIRENYYL
ncbi:ABC transporter ATP-binding protein [Geomesophilobacter sediminis]|uniref:ABC transporter ATP-binding protein n=1 Tax=Geomesophilobacter sediminis TaxID=2798584 RepID=A0A8J7S912_9BACT|nr:ABC transporter ATP-binding protein [Geomesophilobacter sediminis]MBJ6727991.1 ABC transporter ATP-binding protein [Geomesophilobacter sediminis]